MRIYKTGWQTRSHSDTFSEERKPMLTEYIQRAMHHAQYEVMEDGRYFATIAQCSGLWAEGQTLEESRDALMSSLEDWLMVKMRHGDSFEVIDGVDINPKLEYAEAN
jgi:predicted RNase H-like HicB family nuclease